MSVIHFSGPHASGKSTLIRRLEDNPYFMRFERLPLPKCDETFERVKLRTARFYLQSFLENELAAQHPDKHVLSDRCIYDNIAYVNAFLRLGWITQSQMDEFLGLYEQFFPPERRPQTVVFLDLPMSTLVDQLQRRWESRPKKWREENLEYLSEVRRAFCDFYDGKSVIRISEKHADDRVTEFYRQLGQSMVQASENV